MKYLKTLGLAVVAAMALTAFAVGSASATTPEIGGTAKNEKIEITMSPESGTSGVMKNTAGTSLNTCTGGSGTGATTSPYTGSAPTGAIISNSGGTCTNSVTTHKFGTVSIEHISSSTNGTVFASGGEVTTGSPLGTLNCKTSSTHVGTLTGKSSGQATLDVQAVVNCGFLAPSAVAEGVAVVTSPEGLGVTS